MTSRSFSLKIILKSIHLDLIVSIIGLDLLFINKKKLFLVGSSMIFKRALELFLLKSSTSSNIIKRGLLEIDD